MLTNELELFLNSWESEADRTLKVLRALPVTQYDFRPDPGGRSLGELAWHLAEADAYPTLSIERGQFNLDSKPPNIERPRQVELLAPGWARIHNDAVARIRQLKPEDLGRSTPFSGGPTPIGDILWKDVLAHGIHHRGQLTLMCRMAGGQVPNLYGPNREQIAALRAGSTKTKLGA